MEEKELIFRLKANDPAVIDDIVETYKRPLFAFIIRMTGNHAAAEDIFQETWLRVIRYIGKFRGDSKLSTWLFQIALNLCRDAERKKKNWFFVSIEDYAETLSSDSSIDPIRMFKAQQVQKIVDELPVKMKEVMVLRYFHDLSDKEISEVVGCPIGTVKSRFYKASQVFRKKWEQVNK